MISWFPGKFRPTYLYRHSPTLKRSECLLELSWKKVTLYQVIFICVNFTRDLYRWPRIDKRMWIREKGSEFKGIFPCLTKALISLNCTFTLNVKDAKAECICWVWEVNAMVVLPLWKPLSQLSFAQCYQESACAFCFSCFVVYFVVLNSLILLYIQTQKKFRLSSI